MIKEYSNIHILWPTVACYLQCSLISFDECRQLALLQMRETKQKCGTAKRRQNGRKVYGEKKEQEETHWQMPSRSRTQREALEENQ